MDETLINELRESNIDPSFDSPPRLFIPIRRNEAGIVAVSDRVPVQCKAVTKELSLKSIPELFVGNRQAPSFKGGPTGDYIKFFALIEATVIDYCLVATRVERDQEIERLYSLLRRRPAGKDKNPLFSYIQAAVRVYMSLFDVSPSEFDAVIRRLSQSAGHFAIGPTSTNYFQIVHGSLRSIANSEA